MDEQIQQAKFEGWAVVELFGHIREAGYVTTEYFGAACFFRVSVPDLPAREFQLKQPAWGTVPTPTLGGQDILEERRLPVGAIVKRQVIPGKSRLVGASAIYSLNPCTQEEVYRQLEEAQRYNTESLVLVSMPAEPALLTEARRPSEPEPYDRTKGHEPDCPDLDV